VDHGKIRTGIRMGLEEARRTFHALLDSMDEEDFQRQSLNPGWTNGEIMAHITFGFMILNSLLPMVRVWSKLPRRFSQAFAAGLNSITTPFNWFNKLGARMQGKVFTCQRIGRQFDRTMDRLLKNLDSVKEWEWERGMAYPVKWDANFDEFMTVEKLFGYPITHFNFHIGQLSSRGGSPQG